MHLSPPCGAPTRSGSRCRSPAMPNGRCRMHAVKVSGWLIYGSRTLSFHNGAAPCTSAHREGERAVDGFSNRFPIVRVVLLQRLRTFAFGRGEPRRRRARDRAIQCGRSPARNLSAGHGAQLHHVRSEGRPHRLRKSGRNLQRYCGSNFMGGISPIREDATRSAHRPYGKDAYRVERLLGTRLVGHCCIRWPQEVRSLALRRGMRGMHSSGAATGRRHGGPLTAPFSLSCAPSGRRHPRPRPTRRWRPRFWPCEGPNRAGHHRSRVRR
jgi:hypothetical protein